MAYKDLREWLGQVEAAGELEKIDGASWDLEAAAVCSISPNPVLFDKFPGHQPGFRMLASLSKENRQRFLRSTGWTDAPPGGMALTRAWKERLRSFSPVPPVEVRSGPIMENVLTGGDVDLLRFPAPRSFEGEARYIGTGHTVLMRDPDSGRVNMGTYRLQLHDHASTGLHASEGKDGHLIMTKYHRRGLPCPVVGVVGIDPGLFKASTTTMSHQSGAGELDFAGWLKGQPEEVITGSVTGIPIPANAEIAFEGEVYPGDNLPEGPFVEWCGWSQVRDCPVIRVKALYYRNDPILTTCIGREAGPPGQGELRDNWHGAALVWMQMEAAGVREVQGVAIYGYHRIIVVSIKNSYAGHSRQAGLIASQCHSGCYGSAYVIVVDADIDPSNIKDVLWAAASRTEPRRAIQMLDYNWASHLTIQDPSYVQPTEYGMDGRKATYMSRAIIDACKPVEWDPSWHADVRINPKVREEVLAKWKLRPPPLKKGTEEANTKCPGEYFIPQN